MNTRNIYVFLFVIFYLLLASGILVFGWNAAWSVLNVHTLSQTFGDMRSLQGAITSIAQGYDPYFENPGEINGLTLNYPPVWIPIVQFLHIEKPVNFYGFVLAFEVGFLACLAAMLWRYPSIWLLLAAVSGAILMALERGNNDLVIFILVYLALRTRSAAVAVAGFLLAAVLKIFPVFGALALFDWRRRRGSLLARGSALGFFGVAFVLYILIYRHTIFHGMTQTTSAGIMSYGLKVMSFLAEERAGLPFDVVNGVLVAGSVLFAGIVALLSGRIAPVIGVEDTEIADTAELKMFVAGAGIYCLSFLLTSNWDYRMAFCLLTIPFVRRIPHRLLRVATLVTMLFALNQFAMIAAIGPAGGALNVLMKFLLFVLLTGIFTTVLTRRLQQLPGPPPAALPTGGMPD